MIEHESMINCLKAFKQFKLEDGSKEGQVAKDEDLENDVMVQTTLSELAALKPSDLPQTISNQFEKIAKLEDKVKKSIKSAKKAKESAEKAKNKSAGLFKKKAAIESLQGATYDISQSQSDVVDALNISFDYQRQLGEITQYLFMLGVSNILATRTVVKQLKNELQKAPKKKLSELAKAEIISVIKQLEAQEDMAQRIEDQANAIRKNKNCIREGEKKDNEQDARIEENSNKNHEQDIRIEENSNKNFEQDLQINVNRIWKVFVYSSYTRVVADR